MITSAAIRQDYSINCCIIKYNQMLNSRNCNTLVPTLGRRSTFPSRSLWTRASAGRHLLRGHLLAPGHQRSPVLVYLHKRSGNDVVQESSLQVESLERQIIKDNIVGFSLLHRLELLSLVQQSY